jgi:hypothetical protein
MIPTTPVGSGVEKLKNGPETGLAVHLARRGGLGDAGRAQFLDELTAAAFQHLRDPVKDLAPVVRGAAGPSGLRLPRRDDRVAYVLARGARGIGEELSLCVVHGV